MGFGGRAAVSTSCIAIFAYSVSAFCRFVSALKFRLHFYEIRQQKQWSIPERDNHAKKYLNEKSDKKNSTRSRGDSCGGRCHRDPFSMFKEVDIDWYGQRQLTESVITGLKFNSTEIKMNQDICFIRRFYMALIAAICLATLSARAANSGGVSFTPTSLELPVWAISLHSSTDGSSATLYNCAGSTDADCYVDLAQTSQLTALAAKMSNVTVPTDTYDSIDVSYCQNSSGNANYTYQMEGSVSLAGTMYYTATSANGYLTSTAANEAYIAISVPGCSQEYKFTNPVTVSKNSTASITLFTTLVNMGWATNTITSYTVVGSYPAGYNSQSCVNNGASNYVCSNAALLIPYFGTGTPTVQYYQFTDTTAGSGNGVGAQLMVLLDSVGNFIGAFPGRVFTTVTAGVMNFGQAGGFDAQITTISNTSGSSYIVTNGSQTNTSNGFYFSGFQLLSAVNDTVTGSGSVLGNTVDYTETRTQ